MPNKILESVLTIGLSYGAKNVLSYTRRLTSNVLAFRDSPIIPLRRSPSDLRAVAAVTARHDQPPAAVQEPSVELLPWQLSIF